MKYITVLLLITWTMSATAQTISASSNSYPVSIPSGSS